MRSVADAQQAVVDKAQPLEPELIHLGLAVGRFAAADVLAPYSLPSFANSAMDGFAVVASHTGGNCEVVTTIAAGADVATVPAIAPGQAAKIFTGAPLPHGADAVVILEDCKVFGSRVEIPASKAGNNIRKVGEDIAQHQLAVAKGECLTARSIGLLAALGCRELAVTRKPTVAIIATGDELVSLGQRPNSGQIVDSSAWMLQAQVASAGGVATYLGIVADDPAATAAAISHALSHDVVITTGGVSAGERDYVRDALAANALDLEFWKVAMKPGKPFAFATKGKQQVFALPGNPVSSFVAFELFVRPALLAMQGAPEPLAKPVLVTAASEYHKASGREHFVRATVTFEPGRAIAMFAAQQGSAMLASLARCNALVSVPAEQTEVRQGDQLLALML